MEKKQKYELMRKMATMKYIVTDYGTIDLSKSVELQVDVGQVLDRFYKKAARDNKQLRMEFESEVTSDVDPKKKEVAKPQNQR